MISPKFVLRFDDIAPGMAWSKFAAFDALAHELNIPLLVGVVPHCLDPKLAKEPAREDFWDVVRAWVKRGWTIAQHGYTHQYWTKDPGILAISNKSELASLSYEEQFAKLKAGKEILSEQNVWQSVFMAPSHSFDENTLQALSMLGFHYLTDGYGIYPYQFGKITAIPQLFASPRNFGFGVYTICLHVNNMSPLQIQNMLSFIRSHHKQFISFEDASLMQCQVPGVAAITRFATSAALKAARTLRR
jgi:predicted deacetylase